MKRTHGLWILLLSLTLGLPGQGGAQEVITVQSNRGWIGITFTYATATISGEEQTVVVIEDVAEGSPAEEAGIRVGDTVSHLDGQPISQRVFSSLGTLEVGDLVRMTIRREGRPVEVLVEAGPREPMGWVITPNSGEMVIHLDSIRGAILENLDSLRLNITRVGTDSLGQFSISILEAPPRRGEEKEPGNVVFRFPESASPDARRNFVFQEFNPVPFGTFFTESEQTDSLKTELQRLRRALTEVRRAELSRMRELQGGTRQPVEELARTDERIRELRSREEALLQEQASATRALQRMTEEMMRLRLAQVQEEQAEALARFQEAQAEHQEQWRMEERSIREQYERHRPTSLITIGRTFVAGAQLTPLNPSLAEYFKVEEGILVTEVLEGTPADEAGMQAGDVIIRVGGETITSLEDLRFAVGYLDHPLRVRVIRKSQPLEIVIPR